MILIANIAILSACPISFNYESQVLGEEGVTTALVALCKTDSHNCKELIAR